MQVPSFSYPKRIVCLTEETTEVLYNLRASELIVGITKYTVRPAQAQKEKKIIARYIDADIEEILELKPDVVFAWSDLQANIAAELIKNGVEVFTFNHRSVSGILSMILKVGSIVGKSQEAFEYASLLQTKIEKQIEISSKLNHKPKVYFEEWFSPIITGICWVSEIIEICGGIDVFEENRQFQGAKGRILADNDEVIRRNPDIMLASWCGKKFMKKKVLARKAWDNINAIQNDEIYEIDSAIILQPGPASLTDGIDIVAKIISDWEKKFG